MNSNPYGQPSSNSDPYGPPVATTNSSGGYGYASSYSPASPAIPSAPSANINNSNLPDFSKALDYPPPPTTTAAATTTTATNYSSGYNNSSSLKSRDSSDVVATAYPVTNTGGNHHYPSAPTNNGMSLVTSATYKGGPTNGLVSEGTPVKCHKVDYEIKGHEMQLVEIELDPNETVIGEAGGMMYIEDGIKFEAKFGDGSDPKQGFFKSKYRRYLVWTCENFFGFWF
jgi:hypothetical protein